MRRRPLLLALAALMAALAVPSLPALAQQDPPPTSESTTTTTSPPATVTIPPLAETTTTTTTVPPVNPKDPNAVEEVATEPVPLVSDTVPPGPGGGQYGLQAGRIIRQQLRVARAEAVELETTYNTLKQRVVDLEAELDLLEASVTGLATEDRAAVRRVEAARRQFEARTVSAVVRGRSDDIGNLVNTDDPNEIAVARALFSSVLDTDEAAVREYLSAKRQVGSGLVGVAERLVDARLELDDARARLVESRRASVAAQFNLAVFAAGSEIVINGFVFPVGNPHSFGDSFGAPRMLGTTYEHAHQGTDILAPSGTLLLAAERGLITKMGSDVLGGIRIWVKGESGTYYYYAHLSAFAEGMVDGKLVEAGDVIGYVGDTGNARGGVPHLHFEIHPGGGAAVNPYPLLKVVDDLGREARERSGR